MAKITSHMSFASTTANSLQVNKPKHKLPSTVAGGSFGFIGINQYNQVFVALNFCKLHRLLYLLAELELNNKSSKL